MYRIECINIQIFILKIKLTFLFFSNIFSYRNVRIFDKPMRAIQCLDVVLRSPCHSRSVQVGRAFYNPPRERKDLRDGFELWYGLFQAAVLGERPLLNIDVCHKSFPSGQNVIDYIRSLYRVNLNSELDRRSESSLKQYLKGISIIYNPPDGIRRRFKVKGIAQSAETQTFIPENGQKTTVLNYFRSKNYQIQYPKLPCIDVGNSIRSIYLPAELCAIPPGQASTKKDGAMQVREMIRYAAVDTITRKNKIFESFSPFQHNRDPTIRAFGVEIDCNNFLEVDARIINAPRLQYGNNKLIDVAKGSWRAENVEYIQPSDLIKWAILLTDPRQENNGRKFGDMVNNFWILMKISYAIFCCFANESYFLLGYKIWKKFKNAN